MSNQNSFSEQQNDSKRPQGSPVRDKAHEAAERLQGSAREQAGAVRERVETSREHAAERVRRVGDALRNVGHELRDNDDELVAKYADTLSERIERVATYIGSLEPRTLMNDATRFAHERPAWFFGGAFILGLAAGRFLKSSQTSSGDGGDDWGPVDWRPTGPIPERRTPAYANSEGIFGDPEDEVNP